MTLAEAFNPVLPFFWRDRRTEWNLGVVGMRVVVYMANFNGVTICVIKSGEGVRASISTGPEQRLESSVLDYREAAALFDMIHVRTLPVVRA